MGVALIPATAPALLYLVHPWLAWRSRSRVSLCNPVVGDAHPTSWALICVAVYLRSPGLGAGYELLQFALLIQVGNNVAAADELALDVELGDGGPVGVLLDAVADFWVC